MFTQPSDLDHRHPAIWLAGVILVCGVVFYAAMDDHYRRKDVKHGFMIRCRAEHPTPAECKPLFDEHEMACHARATTRASRGGGSGVAIDSAQFYRCVTRSPAVVDAERRDERQKTERRKRYELQGIRID